MRRLFTRKLQYLALAVLAVLALIALLAYGCGMNKRPGRLTFIVSGNSQGFLENCGCAGGQSGGMHRRATFVKAERERAEQDLPTGLESDAVLIDTGNFSDPSDPRMRVRSIGIVRALGMMGYDAVGIGTWELAYEPVELHELLTEAELPYTAANLSFTKPAEGEDVSAKLGALIAPYRVFKTDSGFRVGLIHIIDPTDFNRGDDLPDGYELSSPTTSARKVLAEHKREADFWVLTVAPAPRYGLQVKSVAELTDFQLVFGMLGHNPNQPEDGSVPFPFFVERPAYKGKDMTLAEVTFAENNTLRVHASKSSLTDAHYKPDPEVEGMIAELRPLMEQTENEMAEESLNKKVPKGVPSFVGYTTCNTCHSDIGVQLAGTGHMHAFETLVKLDRQHQSCAECHVVGHNQPGGWNVKQDKLYKGSWDRRDVSCENCHGAGEFHVALHAEGKPIPEEAEGLNAQGLQDATRETCLKCHDGENSPNFNYDQYWPHIQHGNGLEPVPGRPEGAGMTPIGDHIHPQSIGRMPGVVRNEAREWLLAQL